MNIINKLSTDLIDNILQFSDIKDIVNFRNTSDEYYDIKIKTRKYQKSMTL